MTRSLWLSAVLRRTCAAVLAVVALGSLPAHAAPATRAAFTLTVWYGTDDPMEQGAVQTLAQRFGQVHPGIRVRISTYGLDDLNTKMQLALGASLPPDVVYTTPRGPGLPAYVRAGKLRDLTADAHKRGWSGRLRPGILAAYNRLLAPRGHAEGRVYAVPYAMAAVGVLYDKAIFRRLRLHIPHTVAQLAALLPRIARAKLTPLGLGNADGWVGDDWWLSLVNARLGPGPLQPALRLDPHFSFKGAAEQWAGTTLQEWSRQGYFTPDFGGLDAQDSVQTFFEGHTAMQLVSSTENAQILALARQTGLSVGVFSFPSVTPGRPPVMAQSGYCGWAIPRAARHPAAALDFVDAMTSAGTARFLVTLGMLPAYRDDRTLPPVAPFQADDLAALRSAAPGVYLDSAPVPNLNATMEADVQLLLQRDETPLFVSSSLQEVYASYGVQAASTRTDGEF